MPLVSSSENLNTGQFHEALFGLVTPPQNTGNCHCPVGFNKLTAVLEPPLIFIYFFLKTKLSLCEHVTSPHIYSCDFLVALFMESYVYYL